MLPSFDMHERRLCVPNLWRGYIGDTLADDDVLCNNVRLLQENCVDGASALALDATDALDGALIRACSTIVDDSLWFAHDVAYALRRPDMIVIENALHAAINAAEQSVGDDDGDERHRRRQLHASIDDVRRGIVTSRERIAEQLRARLGDGARVLVLSQSSTVTAALGALGKQLHVYVPGSRPALEGRRIVEALAAQPSSDIGSVTLLADTALWALATVVAHLTKFSASFHSQFLRQPRPTKYTPFDRCKMSAMDRRHYREIYNMVWNRLVSSTLRIIG
jgi:Initiation factor 2 subunit family